MVEGASKDNPITADEQYHTLTTLYRALDSLRTLQSDLPLQTVAALLAIAMKQGRSVKEIGDAVGIAPSSASRNIAMLSNWDWKKKKGLDLIEYRQDPQNLTTKNVHLTAKGKRVIEQIVNIF